MLGRLEPAKAALAVVSGQHCAKSDVLQVCLSSDPDHHPDREQIVSIEVFDVDSSCCGDRLLEKPRWEPQLHLRADKSSRRMAHRRHHGPGFRSKRPIARGAGFGDACTNATAAFDGEGDSRGSGAPV